VARVSTHPECLFIALTKMEERRRTGFGEREDKTEGTDRQTEEGGN
jgi:hypothetical protein